MNKTELQILNFWYTMDFLQQEKYSAKEIFDNKTAKENYVKRLNKNYKNIADSIELQPNDNLYDLLCEEAESCEMKTWGNITVYVGKVKREECIKIISKKLKLEVIADERPEENLDEIACFSLQLSPDGKYVEKSLSLSPIIWAINQRNFLEIDADRYSDCITNLEERFFSYTAIQTLNEIMTEKAKAEKEKNGECEETEAVDEADAQEDEDSDTDETKADEIQKFDFHAVNTAVLKKMYSFVVENYLADFQNSSYCMTMDCIFKMYKDEAEKEKDTSNTYMGLSHSYFTSDLKLVTDRYLNETEGENPPAYLTNYINSKITGRKDGLAQRKELVKVDDNPDDIALFTKRLQRILNIKNAPLGMHRTSKNRQ